MGANLPPPRGFKEPKKAGSNRVNRKYVWRKVWWEFLATRYLRRYWKVQQHFRMWSNLILNTLFGSLSFSGPFVVKRLREKLCWIIEHQTKIVSLLDPGKFGIAANSRIFSNTDWGLWKHTKNTLGGNWLQSYLLFLHHRLRTLKTHKKHSWGEIGYKVIFFFSLIFIDMLT